MGRALVGTNYTYVRRRVRDLGLNTAHWKGRAHGTTRTGILLESLLVEKSAGSRGSIKRRLLRAGLLQDKCFVCGLPPEWHGRPLVLHLDHKNGVRDDYRLQNLRLVCPNCHSQTETYAGRNKPATELSNKQCACGTRISRASVSCNACSHALPGRHQTKIVWPSVEDLRVAVAGSSFSAVARALGVSDNAVRKRLRSRA
jgi:hypothetical protein